MSEKAPPRCVESCVHFGNDGDILAQFQEHGFVAVADVFSHSEVRGAIDELWTSPRLLARSPQISREDPATWTEGCGWPQQNGGKNFLESLDPFQDRCCWELAANPKVAHVVNLLWQEHGSEVFLGRTPRWGVMRPSGARAEWRTLENWLHWDQNPWTQPEFGWIQAFACLTAQTPDSGGLLCVPGFHKRWKEWGEKHPEGSVCVGGKQITRAFGQGNPFPVPLDDPVHEQVVRICVPAGSLLLWDSRLPHQNFPNSSQEAWRVVLYMNFWPLRNPGWEERREVLKKRLVVCRALGYETWWPTGLSDHGRHITASPDAAAQAEAQELLAQSPELVEAIRVTHAAGEAELRGELSASTGLLRRALKLWPSIEAWHEAIFI